MVDFPIPKAKDKEIDENILDSAVVSGEIDYMCHSKRFIISIDQAGYRSCVINSSRKLNWDEVLLLVINGLPTLLKLDGTRVRIIIAMCSHAFVSGCDSNDEFNKMLNRSNRKAD